jgi:hypothetical protein
VQLELRGLVVKQSDDIANDSLAVVEKYGCVRTYLLTWRPNQRDRIKT